MDKQNIASKIKLSSFNDLFGLNDSIREVSDREIEEEIISLLQNRDRSQWGNTEVKYE